MSLCLNLSSVLKSEPYIVFIINSSVVHKAAPQLFVKFSKQVILLAEGVEKGINRTEPCLLIGDFFGNRSMASLGEEEQPIYTLPFSNIYTASGSIIFDANKVLTGRELEDEQFEFVLTDADGDIIETVRNDKDGKIVFSEIFYNQDELGEYVYRIYEVDANADGYSYDETIYEIVAEVTDNGDGTLDVTIEISNADDPEAGIPVEGMVFTNIYTASGSIIFDANKVLTGRELEDEQFEFVLTDADGDIIETVRNDKDGKIVFSEIFYNQDELGEYVYRIYEVDAEAEYYGYDGALYNITVTVTDNADGTLGVETSVEKEIKGEKSAAEKIEFHNTYEEPTPPPQTGSSTNKHWAVIALSALSIFGLAVGFKRKRYIK